MSLLLPVAALATAAASAFVPSGSAPPSGTEPTVAWRTLSGERPAWIAVAAFALIVAVVGWRSEAHIPGATAGGIGLVIGCVIVLAARVLEASRVGAHLHPGPLALAAAGVAMVSLRDPASIAPSQMGLVLGAASAAWILGNGLYVGAVAGSAALIAAANLLGETAVGGHSGQAGTAVAVVAALAGLVASAGAQWLHRQRGTPAPEAAVWAATLLLLAGGWVLGTRYLYLGAAATLLTIGAAAGWVLHWVVSQEQPGEEGELRFALGSVLVVALATLAFASLRGYGMALSTLGAAAVLVLAGNPRALMCLGPAWALVGYRLFRETHTDVSRAFDIGQHYAIVGILLAVLMCVAVAAWRPRSAERAKARAAAVALSAAATMAAMVAGAVFLGSKGVVGALVGLGLAVFVAGMRGTRSLSVMVLAIQAWATLVLVYGWLRPWLDLTRDDKLALLGWFAAIGGAVAWTTVMLGRTRLDEEVAS